MRESGGHALLLEVAGHLLALHGAGGVLRAHRDLRHLLGLGRMDRVQHLDLLVAHVVGGEAHRRLHAKQRQQLQHVVLDQVAQRARVVVVAGAAADAEVLGGGDLDVVDVVAVPDRLEHAVREPERQHVLDGLLAEVVVDPEDLRLVEHAQHLAVELARLGQLRAERLLDHHAHLGLAVDLVQAVLAQLARRSPGRTPAPSRGRRRG